MALTTSAYNLEYSIGTTDIIIGKAYGRRVWTIGNMSGSNVFALLGPTDDTDARLVAFTGTEAQLRALSDMMIQPFSRIIIPADVEHVALCTGTTFTGRVHVASGEQDPPEPVYVAAELDVPAAASTEIVADPGAAHQIWLYAAHLQAAALATVTFEDGALLNLSGDIPVGANGGFIWPHTQVPSAPWIKCTTSESLKILTVGAGGTGDGMFIYADVIV